ncbi:tetratricopeptide repeat-containing diguanylate cyclase [Alteromonas sp. ASW11-130]|uniref:tetratricopeptide repeat-containing diguanylate cyclase n=1 Tax=Alteromonas sp. ASW11-130 TaxID=3015775 RepID=UPI0022428AD3|nr:diguanylate cyclase [Alteromonas sp. ASW11-130]MCW8091642.1 diguanylate cyclase [Alteromonas sp. ASW11-130]
MTEAKSDAIRVITSAQTKEQLQSIVAYQDAGRLTQAESLSLLLLERARTQQNDIDVAAAFHEIGHISILQNKYELARNAFNNALEIFTREGLLKPIAVILADIGTSYRYQSEYNKALNFHYRALSLFQSEENRLGIAAQQLNIGIVLKELGQFEPALSYLKRALTELRQQNRLESVSQALSHIGGIYVDMGQYEAALMYAKDALAISEETQSRHRIAKNLSRLGDVYLRLNQYELAKTHLEKALVIFTELEAPRDHGSVLTVLGQVEIASGHSDVGLQYLNEALAIANTDHYPKLKTDAQLALARAFLSLQQNETALTHALRGVEQTSQRHELSLQAQFLQVIVDIYVAQQNYEKAFSTLIQKNQVVSKIMSENSAMTVAQMQSEIEVERQAQSIEMLRKNRAIELARAEQTNLRTTLALGGLTATLLFLFLLWGRYNTKRLNLNLQNEVRKRTQELVQKNNELEDAYTTLEQVSLRDRLTGLYNRHYLEAQLPGEIQRCQHTFATAKPGEDINDADLLCFLLDIDNFKKINDEHGHMAGDRFLVQFTEVIHEVFRQTDLLIRWGGEEFLVVCRQANRAEMCMLAERFRVAVSERVFEVNQGKTIRASCSIGFCTVPLFVHSPYRVNWKKTFLIMDYCLYAAKASGKNCWVGALSAKDEEVDEASLSHFAKKFEFNSVTLATSLNNLASINWPGEK